LKTALIFQISSNWGCRHRAIHDHTILLQDLRLDLLQAQSFGLGNNEDHKHEGEHCYDAKQEKYIGWPKELLWYTEKYSLSTNPQQYSLFPYLCKIERKV
jgi:hypothetical protein